MSTYTPDTNICKYGYIPRKLNPCLWILYKSLTITYCHIIKEVYKRALILWRWLRRKKGVKLVQHPHPNNKSPELYYLILLFIVPTHSPLKVRSRERILQNKRPLRVGAGRFRSFRWLGVPQYRLQSSWTPECPRRGKKEAKESWKRRPGDDEGAED